MKHQNWRNEIILINMISVTHPPSGRRSGQLSWSPRWSRLQNGDGSFFSSLYPPHHGQFPISGVWDSCDQRSLDDRSWPTIQLCQPKGSKTYGALEQVLISTQCKKESFWSKKNIPLFSLFSQNRSWLKLFPQFDISNGYNFCVYCSPFLWAIETHVSFLTKTKSKRRKKTNTNILDSCNNWSSKSLYV